jgi:hypothetical protein
MALTIDQRAQFLKILDSMGGADAFKAGLELLQKMDKENFDPRTVAKPTPETVRLATEVDKLPVAAGWKDWKCYLKCIPACAGRNWVECAACVAACVAGG